jgi:drug/metabolite transporter (DMT)-like permease
MTAGVFALVLGAALLHAAWNALVKVNVDRIVMVATMMISQAAVAVLAVPFVELPTPGAWLCILASTALLTGYFGFLLMAYRHGDLSHVYPISRGSAPLIVAVASAGLLGEMLSFQAMLSVALIAIGIMSLTLTRGAGGLREPKAVLYALGAGVFIASYTIVDGLGARLSVSAHSYVFWLNLFDGIPIILMAFYLHRRQAIVKFRASWKIGALAGMASLLAYWIVLWAMTQAPIALVSAVREMSMIFAVIFGVVLLKERLDLARLASTAVTLAGAILLKTSR